MSDVRVAVLSHLHEDHIGGIRELPAAEFVVSQGEWATMERPFPDQRGLMRRHIDLPGARYRKIAFAPIADPELTPFGEANDLMGDGSLLLLPTPGHAPGSMSLLVRRASGAPLLLMVGDLTYEVELLDAGRIPGVGNREALRRASAMVVELRRRHPELVVLPAHDPGASGRLARAPGQAPAVVAG